MGKRKHDNLPPRMRIREYKGRRYYYYEGEGRKLIALGTDYPLALKHWAELENDTNPFPHALTFRAVAERYRVEVVPTKAPLTQTGNLKELANLLAFFDDPPVMLDNIKPLHVRQYLDWRKAAPVRANREIVLLSHIWNRAREWGYTDLANPVLGVRKNIETGRDVYIEDDVYQRVWGHADEPLRDAVDLAYLTGQRPADVLKISEIDLKDGTLHVKQNKTGAKLQIAVIGELAVVIERILKRKRGIERVRALSLIVNEKGQPLTYRALNSRFRKARAKAGIASSAFQFRDLRAKAGTDKSEAQGLDAAKKQLGHTSVITTEHYVRHRKGTKVEPTK